jgi:hypothetical protein
LAESDFSRSSRNDDSTVSFDIFHPGKGLIGEKSTFTFFTVFREGLGKAHPAEFGRLCHPNEVFLHVEKATVIGPNHLVEAIAVKVASIKNRDSGREGVLEDFSSDVHDHFLKVGIES